MSITRTSTELSTLSHSGQERQSHSDEDSPTISLRGSDDVQVPANAVEIIPDGGYGWTVVGACSFLLFWINGYTTCWGVLQEALLKRSSIKVDVITITFVGSLYMGCMVAFGTASVKLMKAFGVRYACVTAIILFGSAPILISFTLDNIGGLFCTAGILVGFSSSVVYTATNSMPTQWFSGRLGTANGLVKTGGGIGATVLPLAVQALIDSVGLQWAFRILGFLMLATGVPAAFLLKERGSRVQAAYFEWALLKNPPFLTLCLAGAVGVFALFVPPFFLPLFASSIGLSASTGAGLVAGFGGSTAVGRLLSGMICDRIGAFNTLAITVLVNALSMLAIWPVSASLPPLFVFAIVNGCANGSFFVALPTAVTSLAPGSAASSISLMVSFWTPGYLLGSPIAGILIQKTGAAHATSIGPYRAAIFYAAGVGLLSAFLVILTRVTLDKKLFKKL